MSTTIRLHFTQLKFNYYTSTASNIKYANFYNTKNHLVYEKLSHQWSKELAEELFVSNFLFDTSKQIHSLDSVNALDIRSDWLKRLHTIPFNLKKDIKYLMDAHEIDDFIGLLHKMEYAPPVNTKRIINQSDVSSAPFRDVDKFYVHFVTRITPESTVVLNALYKKKYHFDFLRRCIDSKIDPVSLFIKRYKYLEFLDIDYLLDTYKTINTLYSVI